MVLKLGSDGSQNARGLVFRQHGAIGQRTQQVGCVRRGVDPVQIGIVPAQIALGLQIGDRFRHEAVISLGSHEGRFSFPFRRLGEAENRKRSLQNRIRSAFADSPRQVRTPFIGKREQRIL